MCERLDTKVHIYSEKEKKKWYEGQFTELVLAGTCLPGAHNLVNERGKTVYA